jgi:hypothetical protein
MIALMDHHNKKFNELFFSTKSMYAIREVLFLQINKTMVFFNILFGSNEYRQTAGSMEN